MEILSNTEIFRYIPGFDKLYQVSNFGRVVKVRNGKIKSLSLTNVGYLVTGLTKNGKTKNYLVHRLVMSAFGNTDLECKDRSVTIDHINNDKTDNRFINLREISHRDNKSKNSNMGVRKAGSRYRAEIRKDDKLVHLGYFDSRPDALQARKEFLTN